MISIARATTIVGIAVAWIFGLYVCTGSALAEVHVDVDNAWTAAPGAGVARWDQDSMPKLTLASKPSVGGDDTSASQVAVTSPARTAIPATPAPSDEEPGVTPRAVLGVGLLIGAIASAVAVGVWLERLRV